MPVQILMPALSPTMEEGTLSKWLVKEGDTIKAGKVIAEIETDKATMEVEAVDEGIIDKILVQAGTEGVKVNAPIAVMRVEGEASSPTKPAPAAVPAPAAAPPAPAAKTAAPPPPPPAKPAPAPAAPPAPAAKPSPAPVPMAAAPATEPAERAPAAPLPPPLRVPTGTPKTAPPEVKANGTPPANGHGDRVFASPLARRIARDGGIDLDQVKGSGPHGRIVKADIDIAITSGATPARGPSTAIALSAPPEARAVTPATTPLQPMADDKILALYEQGSYEVVPHDGMRKVIAQRLTQSKQTVPHFYMSVDCRLDELLRARERINAASPKDGPRAYKLSVNDFVIKALALGLQRVPAANATWTEGGMLRHRHSDVGVAVAVEGGLFTPVIRAAELKTLAEISNEMKDLADRARRRRLAPHEYQGGTTSISNLGMFGIKQFDAVINPPHATILAVGAGEKRPVVAGDKLEVATIMTCTLSCDHRVVDGAVGAELLNAFKILIEDPVRMLV